MTMVAHSLRAQGQLAHRDDVDTLVRDAQVSVCEHGSMACPECDGVTDEDEAYSETGQGWWGDGVAPLRAEGENRPSRPSTVVASLAVRGREGGQEWELGQPGVGNALRAGDGGSSRGNWMLAQAAVRRLTPLECERLQGFPDGWTDQLSDSVRYRVLGNAVCVPVAAWIGRRIVEQSR